MTSVRPFGRGLRFALLSGVLCWAAGAFGTGPSPAIPEVPRGIPRPLDAHPGNVFLTDEEATISVPEQWKDTAKRWRALDEQLALVAEGSLEEGRAALGRLPIGWYRVEFLDGAGTALGHTTAASLAPLSVPTPQDSPICIDTALSWYKSEAFGEDPAERKRLISLAALAGANWSRDRLRWDGVENASGEPLEGTKYHAAAAMQAEAGLKVLQTYHRTPSWAVAEGSSGARAPDDLRRTYAFCRSLAERFEGQVQAWEPWNEGNASNFGAHTIDELCSHQKAAYLGFKAGSKDVTVCWGPLGGINTARIARGVRENETWPYFDVYSIHSYDWPHAYEDLWAPTRDAASGRPVWVTECDRGMKADPESEWGDFSQEFGLRKAEFMAQSYTRSLYSGSSRHFHFILGHYMEGQRSIQFGLLRKDLTPRRSYVAFAALGRLLAGAECLGRWDTGAPDVHIYGFSALPEGERKLVLVAWTEGRTDWPGRGKAKAPWKLPAGVAAEGAYDYLGRPLSDGVPQVLGTAPVFAVLNVQDRDAFDWTNLSRASFRPGAPCPVVLQLQTPGRQSVERKEGWTHEYDRAVVPGDLTHFVVNAYNFGEKSVTGIVVIEELPSGWSVDSKRWEINVGPMGMEPHSLHIQAPKGWDENSPECWVKIRGRFGLGAEPVLTFRVAAASPSDKKEG